MYDFPASPTPGQEYTPPVGGQTYIWQPPRWLVKGVPPAGGGGGGGIDEAPTDGKQYGRQTAAWTEVIANPTWTTLTGKPATFPPTLPIAQSDVTGLVAGQSAQDTAIAGKAASVHTHAESDVTNLVSDLAAKAPLASPVFTGNPTAPTPTVGDADTSIATTAFVAAAVSTIVGGAIIADTPPPSPQPGQLFWESDSGNTYIWYVDPSGPPGQWVQQSVVPGPLSALTSIVQTVITTSGTYTKPAGLKFLEVWLVGAGGAGSRAGATGAGQASAGGGGGGGSVCIKFYAASDLAASEAYTIGASGVGGSTAGTSGGTSTFKGLSAGGGGGGGALMAATGVFTISGRGGGGTATGGDINMMGGGGENGAANLGVVGAAKGGAGGSSYFAPFAPAGWVASGSGGTNPPTGLGGGSGGGGNGVGQGAGQSTSDGSVGAIILKEYF